MARAVVWLRDVRVGQLTFQRGSSDFVFDPEYITLLHRPVLSLSFEDQGLNRAYRASNGPPSFFGHLLPQDQGELKELLVRNFHVTNDYALLELLGHNLPGAVRVVTEGGGAGFREAGSPAPDERLRVSLGGMQLKFGASPLDENGRLAVPGAGSGSTWIIKFPSTAWPELTAVEAVTLSWARRLGVQVPQMRVVQARDVDNLPVTVDEATVLLAVERFDRTAGGGRIHAEDFAQVFGRPCGSEGIYKGQTYAGIARVVRTLADQSNRDEYGRRLVFMVLSGNGDAHLKNWGLLYPGRGIIPTLSPAYDLLCTRPFIHGQHDELALNLGGPAGRVRAWGAVRRGALLQVLLETGLEREHAEALLDAMVARAAAALEEAIAQGPALRASTMDTIRAHLTGMISQLRAD